MSPEEYQNPFNELYLSEAIEDPGLYLRWFSPAIITGETRALFRRGNTVLRGSNGVGKTMLLRLFAAGVRASYWRDPPDAGWTIPMQDAIGIGINFIHAGFGSLGKRALASGGHESREQWALVVGDLLNYYLVDQLLQTLSFFRREGAIVAERTKVDVDVATLDRFAATLSAGACWFGALDGVATFDDLQAAVSRRIRTYRSFVNWNRKSLGTEIASTKTTAGLPLLEARNALGVAGVLPARIALVVTLDQYETLYHTDYGGKGRGGDLGRAFCRTVNSLLAQRSSSVSYKVGVRHYAWGPELRSTNTDAKLEVGRDYHIVDLDAILRRRENRKAWIFPRFAEDVAERRMVAALGSENGGGKHAKWLKVSLEKLRPEEEIDRYCRDDPERIRPGRRGELTDAWAQALKGFYAENKYRAKLAEAWLRQRQGTKSASEAEAVSGGPRPWDRPWWEKERREALLTQVASMCAQRRLYSGWGTLLTLSGSNILVFISLCREVWDHWDRAQSRAKRRDERMSADVQSQAVRIVASDWLEKQEEFPRGSTRKAFVVRLGIAMRKALIADEGLAYPGHTGFSLAEEDLRSDDVVREFLEDAVDYGALVCFEHTTKEKDGKARRKWYLSPILCPNFEVPAIRTKEPYYARVAEVRRWLEGDEVVFGRGNWVDGRRRGRGAGLLF